MKNIKFTALATICTCLTFSTAMVSQAKEMSNSPSIEKEQTFEHNRQKLSAILDIQSEENKARYDQRHPEETIEFFEIEPGMVVADVLPGGGYYTKILLPYLGEEGRVIGIDYPRPMWALIGRFADAEFLEARKTWAQTWINEANQWRNDGDAGVDAVALGDINEERANTVDAVIMIRALHNLSRFEDEGQFLTSSLKEINTILKPGGILGVVQHRAPEKNSDEWAQGDNGYLKESTLIKQIEEAGFTLTGKSEINANPKDQPTESDIVWRLPPSIRTSDDDPKLHASYKEIGESDRMTLKFTKK